MNKPKLISNDKLRHLEFGLQQVYVQVFKEYVGTRNLINDWQLAFQKICEPFTLDNKIFNLSYYKNTEESITIGHCHHTGNTYFNYCELKTGKGVSISLNKNNDILSKKKWSSIKINKQFNAYSKMQVLHRFHVELFTYYTDLTFEQYATGVSETLSTCTFYKLYQFHYDEKYRKVIWFNWKWENKDEQVHIIGSDLANEPEIISILSKVEKSHKLWKRFFRN